MKSKSFRGQLTRAALITFAVAITLSSGALLAYESLSYRSAWVRSLTSQAELISRATAAALVFNDPKVARENLVPLQSQPRIRAAAVYDANGKLVATYSATPDEHLPLTSTEIPVGAHFNGGTLEVAYPVDHDRERVGTVYLRAQHDIGPRLASYALILGAIGAASMGLAFYIFGSLQRRITTPLEKMTEVAQEVINTRNLTLRAPATEYRDISVLVEAFNEMLSECGMRTSELEREMVVRQNAEQELRLADKRKDAFLATLAHELRNPLAPMTGAIALIQLPAASPAAKAKAVTILERQMRQMVRLIDDLLDASRITTGKLSLNKEAVNMSSLLRTAVELAQPAATQSGLTLTLDLPQDELYVDGDEIRLSQVLSNLLNNACRYTKAGGAIDVALRAVESGSIDVSIRDTGIGIEPDMQERIFDMFEQADKSLGRGNAGLGVGLTLARQLVRLHDGDLSVSSAGLGHGSCFTVRLPLLKSVPAAVEAADRLVTEPQALRILLADDNVDLTESFALLLRTFGHLVDVVWDGEAAVRAATERPPDIALLDIGMPKLDGYEVARQLRANMTTRGIRLVAMTGWGQESDKQRSKTAGFDRHLVKPIDTNELLVVIQEMLKKAA